MINGTPSPWLNMPLEVLKEMKDRYKLVNDLTEQQHRESSIQQKAQDDHGESQMQAMQDRLPFLDRG